MNQSKTPRTDDATLRAIDIEGGGEFQAVHIQVSKRLERELIAVTEQRDEALEKVATMVLAGDYNDLFIAKVTGNFAARAEITTVTAQRDRLAVALREMQYCHTDKAERMANEAFQYLTTNEQ